ncbi:BZRAP1 (predicted), partial [Pycnogonum litorale]
MLEMTSLKRLQAKQSWSNSQQSSIADGLTSPESSISTPDNVQNRQVRTTLSNGDTNMVSNYNSSNEVLTFHAPTIPLDSYSCGNTSGFGTVLESTSKEIDRILSRIAHDNKVLAELDRPRSALGFSMVTESPDMSTGFYDSHYRNLDDRMIVNNDDGYCLKSSHSMNELDSLQAISERNTFSSRRVDNISNARTRPFVKYSYVNPELDRLMAKLEQDNRVLAELDKTRACIGISTTLSTLNRATVTNTTALASSGGFGTYVDSNRNFTDPSRNILKYSTDSRHTVTIDENAEFLELPGKGQVQVFVAKYTYDPLMHSPNENPEAELSVTSGEYVIVYGDMDEDGFYDGELPDGRRGLVPSNFVIKLTGEDLYDFQTQVLYGSTKDSDDSSASFSQELDYLDDYHLPLEDYKRMNDYVDLEDIEEVDEDNLSDQEVNDTPAPNPPQRLTLEKQLNKSILISWIPPDGGTSTVESYDVYVDGVLKNTVKSQERTRALVEGVDSSKPHRISVRSVSDSGKQSKDAACTITIGKESPLAPAYVTATSITSTSAIISWLPSNSNFQHVICVNSVEVRIVKPGIFRHTITGLAPNTEYRVSVRSKAGKSAPSKSAFNDEKNRKKMEKLTTYVDFRTLPKGLPDPPIDVQVESGPQDGTLLVSWLPVTISATGGTSNGCPVNGYSVYVDGKRMGEIDSPTADHTLLDITSVQPTQVKSVTVRTKSGDSVSADSISCKVPAAVIKGKRKGYDDMADDSSDRDELSDIAEEAEEDLSDTIQAKAAEKKDGRSINKENVDKEKKKSEKRSVKESQSKEVRNSQKSLRSTSKKKSEVIERRNSSDQVVMETEDNLSDKEIIPDMHINIPSIDYDINCSKSQGVSDGRRSERDRQNQQKRVMQNSPVTGSDKCATTYQDKRVTSQVTPQPTPRRSNTGYNNGYGGEEEYSRRESDYNRRDGDYRHDEGHRRDVDYRRDRDYGRRDSEYSRRETGEYSRRHSDYRRETDNIRERERHRPNGPVPYRDQPISNHARLFVALFDYDPQTMSPNPDGADEELPFNEGQIIK